MRDQVTSSLAQIVGRQHVILPEDGQELYILSIGEAATAAMHSPS